MSYLLFADDNEDMRHMVRDLLRASGHEVSLARDGPSALEEVQRREPDLLILDLAMPGLTGLEVCRRIKDNPFTCHIPVLMLTGEGDIERKVEGFEAGADDYLAKPFDPRELRARIVALLRIVRREGDRNPTTGLPGGRAIEEEIERRVALSEAFSVLYIDLDNFKPFADTFGFSLADSVIRETGRVVRAAVEAVGGERDFVGHIGGDDFIIVTGEGFAESIAEECAARFRAVIRQAVGEEALSRGAFPGVDREGMPRNFPIARLSAAVVAVQPGHEVTATYLGTRAAEVKRRAKQLGGGTILVEAV